MKRYLVLVLIITILTSCNKKNDKAAFIEYYPVSITKIVTKEIEAISTSKDSVCKIVQFKDSKIEHHKIPVSDVESDLRSFLEFDINKPAWQKSYTSQTVNNNIRFSTIEDKLPLKFIDIQGDIKSPECIRFYFQNSNNLYQSTKVIEWVPNKYYYIYSIQDVKGMNADTLFVKTYLGASCNFARVTSSTGN